MKGSVWLMQGGGKMVSNFFAKIVPSNGHSLVGVWVKIGSNGVAAKIKSHLQGVWCLRGQLRRNLSQRNSNFQIPGILWDRKESQGAGEGELKRGKTGQRPGSHFKDEKEACLKELQREDILYQDVLLQSKCWGTLVGRCMAFYTPGAVGGGSFKKLWPLAPRYPLTPNHKILKEQPAIDPSTYT